MTLLKIPTARHPVKVGLSDAYYIDRPSNTGIVSVAVCLSVFSVLHYTCHAAFCSSVNHCSCTALNSNTFKENSDVSFRLLRTFAFLYLVCCRHTYIPISCAPTQYHITSQITNACTLIPGSDIVFESYDSVAHTVSFDFS